MPENTTRCIAATDYDGTLYLGGEVSNQVITAIREWRRAGHLFGVVTGRDLSMICHEIKRWQIPFDFLVCCNGAVLYDAKMQELQRHSIANTLIRPLLSHPLAANSLHYECSAADRTFFCLRSSKSSFPQLGVPYHSISEEEALAMENLQMVNLAFLDAEAGERCVELLQQDFGATLQTHRNGPNVDITALGVNKAQGLQDLLRRQRWSEASILVIGDAENDLPMIRHFQGFSLFSAHEQVQKEAQALYASVEAMLADYILTNSANRRYSKIAAHLAKRLPKQEDVATFSSAEKITNKTSWLPRLFPNPIPPFY